MDIIIGVVSLLIVATKFLDCYTTARGVRGVEQEVVPFAALLMKKIGVQTTIWGIFGLSVLLVIFAVILLFGPPAGSLYRWAYVILGTGIAVIQFAVAHTNHTKRFNAVTRTILKTYRGLRRIRF
jgi:bacteriorhodopsin